MQELGDEFDFVLLAEHFDESLVILARKICWDLEEVGGQMLLKVHLYMRDVSGGGGLRATWYVDAGSLLEAKLQESE